MAECRWCAGEYTTSTWDQHTRSLRHRVWTFIGALFYGA
ncbi:hypothetical protein HWC44_gp031 [Mycobacterium phage ThetaBob]|uniref:Uncharacterized protein n=1 Tax=Mycobacterium phage ThetaBob TaxID=2588513 RepID=A0A4Y6EMJ1_9CAUD|nr:hypothetical protein HWC44_gp031 [Mycobacterium phage ThetaBob]QDF19918.1 hypothetical protein SEA_THETABOB_31 [Mycobacterium phage ThetaBob]